MDKAFGLLFLVLLHCYMGNTQSQNSCPFNCQCFNSVQILCADQQMTSLPRNLSREVKEFIMINSVLLYLFPHTFRGSPQITKLIFISNRLQSVHAQAFEHLTELQELEISGNPKLEHLYLGTLSNKGNLTKLLLNFNSFEGVSPGMFDSLKQLETLQMKGNVISDLPADRLLNLHNLRVLDLSQNKLENISLATLARLEILKMNDNLISNLPSDIFHNISHLIELHLEGNNISELADDTFLVLTKLEVLNLRGNRLTTFSSKVFGFEASNLKELNLKGNRLTELSSLSCLTSLLDLNLSSNQLSVLPEDTFTNVTALEYLDLSENQLTLLPGTIFHNLLEIKAIHLNKNNLSRVDPNLFEDQKLIQQLYLSDNLLETLPQGLLDPLVHTVRLHGNPWKCDCNMSYLHKWLLNNRRTVEMLDRMLCESPWFLRKRPVVSVRRDQLVCQLSKDHMSHLGSCSLYTQGDAVVLKCEVGKCSPLTVKVEFEDDDGNIMEHTLKKEQCSNETMIQIPVE